MNLIFNLFKSNDDVTTRQTHIDNNEEYGIFSMNNEDFGEWSLKNNGKNYLYNIKIENVFDITIDIDKNDLNHVNPIPILMTKHHIENTKRVIKNNETTLVIDILSEKDQYFCNIHHQNNEYYIRKGKTNEFTDDPIRFDNSFGPKLLGTLETLLIKLNSLSMIERNEFELL
jgi:hypothetical protein